MSVKDGAVGDGDVTISYSAKELLEGLRDEVRQYRSEVGAELVSQGKRIDTLEIENAARKRFKVEMREIVVACAAVLAAVGTSLGVVVSIH